MPPKKRSPPSARGRKRPRQAQSEEARGAVNKGSDGHSSASSGSDSEPEAPVTRSRRQPGGEGGGRQRSGAGSPKCPVCSRDLSRLTSAARERHVGRCVQDSNSSQAAAEAGQAEENRAALEEDRRLRGVARLHRSLVPGLGLALGAVFDAAPGATFDPASRPALLAVGGTVTSQKVGGIVMPTGTCVEDARLQVLAAAYATREPGCVPAPAVSASSAPSSEVLTDFLVPTAIPHRNLANVRRGCAVEFVWRGVPMWGQVLTRLPRSGPHLMARLTVQAYSSGVELSLLARDVWPIEGGSRESLASDVACEGDRVPIHFHGDDDGSFSKAPAQVATPPPVAPGSDIPEVAAGGMLPSTASSSAAAATGGGRGWGTGGRKATPPATPTDTASAASGAEDKGARGPGRRGSSGENLHEAGHGSTVRARRKYISGRSLRWDMRVYFCDRLDEVFATLPTAPVPGTGAPHLLTSAAATDTMRSCIDMTLAAFRHRRAVQRVPEAAAQAMLASHIPHWQYLRGICAVPVRRPPLPLSSWQTSLLHCPSLTSHHVWLTLGGGEVADAARHIHELEAAGVPPISKSGSAAQSLVLAAATTPQTLAR